MSAERTSALLLRLYPPGWRARYGEELQALIVESSGGRPITWHTRIDVGLAGGRERLRSAGLAGDSTPPAERVRSGVLLVLCAWALFVVAGLGVAKFSEHWQDTTPAGDRGLPAGAFQALTAAAAVGSVLVLAGIAAALPSLLAFLRGGGWAEVRGRLATAALLTVVTLAAAGGTIGWAHGLTVHERNGGDTGYSIAFVCLALLAAACLAAWAAAAVTTARRLSLSGAVLRLDAWLASAVTVAMGAMTAAAVTWWAALAHSAPWALAGEASGSRASAVAPQLVAYAAVMLIATLLGATGASRAVRALPSAVRR